jgi:hypothetical protein
LGPGVILPAVLAQTTVATAEFLEEIDEFCDSNRLQDIDELRGLLLQLLLEEVLAIDFVYWINRHVISSVQVVDGGKILLVSSAKYVAFDFLVRFAAR